LPDVRLRFGQVVDDDLAVPKNRSPHLVVPSCYWLEVLIAHETFACSTRNACALARTKAVLLYERRRPGSEPTCLNAQQGRARGVCYVDNAFLPDGWFKRCARR
jgi:hypothetical protein